MSDATTAKGDPHAYSSCWRPDEHRNRTARDTALKALTSDTVMRDLARYYRWESNYAGATFVGLQPNNASQVEPVDLLAVTTLSVDIPPMAIRRFTDPSTSAQLSSLLRRLDPDLRLEDPEAREVSPVMAEFYGQVKLCLRRANARSSGAWVTASKICARKRPHLFPVRDSTVVELLGLTGNYPDDWPVFGSLVADAEVVGHLDVAVAAVTSEGTELGGPDLRLRHLDVVLWMHAVGQG